MPAIRCTSPGTSSHQRHQYRSGTAAYGIHGVLVLAPLQLVLRRGQCGRTTVHVASQRSDKEGTRLQIERTCSRWISWSASGLKYV